MKHLRRPLNIDVFDGSKIPVHRSNAGPNGLLTADPNGLLSDNFDNNAMTNSWVPFLNSFI